MRVNPGHRSSARTLHQLARHHLFFDLDPRQRRSLAPVQAVLERAVARLARHGGGQAAQAACEREALRLTGLESTAGFNRDERVAWARWAPIVASLPGLGRWPAAERRALAEVVRAKAARRETDFLLRVAAQPRLVAALGLS
jgi:hypothetical protein